MAAKETQDHENQSIDELDSDSIDYQEYEVIEENETEPIENQEHESEQNSESEQRPINKTFRMGCMTFCLAVTFLFIWIWQHQSQFNDNYRDALFLMKKGEPEKAIEAYQKAIKNKKRTIFFKYDPSAYNNLGHVYLQTGQFNNAIDTFRIAIDIAPEMPQGYVNLATVYLRKNEPDDAREICTHALQTFPDEPRLFYNLACAYALSDDTLNALNSLKKAYALDPELINQLIQNEDSLKQILPEFQ